MSVKLALLLPRSEGYESNAHRWSATFHNETRLYCPEEAAFHNISIGACFFFYIFYFLCKLWAVLPLSLNQKSRTIKTCFITESWPSICVQWTSFSSLGCWHKHSQPKPERKLEQMQGSEYSKLGECSSSVTFFSGPHSAATSQTLKDVGKCRHELALPAVKYLGACTAMVPRRTASQEADAVLWGWLNWPRLPWMTRLENVSCQWIPGVCSFLPLVVGLQPLLLPARLDSCLWKGSWVLVWKHLPRSWSWAPFHCQGCGMRFGLHPLCSSRILLGSYLPSRNDAVLFWFMLLTEYLTNTLL